MRSGCSGSCRCLIISKTFYLVDIQTSGRAKAFNLFIAVEQIYNFTLLLNVTVAYGRVGTARTHHSGTDDPASQMAPNFCVRMLTIRSTTWLVRKLARPNFAWSAMKSDERWPLSKLSPQIQNCRKYHHNLLIWRLLGNGVICAATQNTKLFTSSSLKSSTPSSSRRSTSESVSSMLSYFTTGFGFSAIRALTREEAVMQPLSKQVALKNQAQSEKLQQSDIYV